MRLGLIGGSNCIIGFIILFFLCLRITAGFMKPLAGLCSPWGMEEPAQLLYRFYIDVVYSSQAKHNINLELQVELFQHVFQC